MIGTGNTMQTDGHLRRISILIFCAVALTMAVVVLQLLSNRAEVQRATEALVVQNLSGARDDLKSHLGKLVRDYAYWDEAYQKAHLSHDSEWLDENFGSYLTEAFDVQGVFLVYADGRVLQVSDGQVSVFQAGRPDLITLVGSLRDLAARARQSANDKGTSVSHESFIRFQGKIATVATALIMPLDSAFQYRISDLPSLVFIQPIAEDWLSTLKARLSLRHIALVDLSPTGAVEPLHPPDEIHPEGNDHQPPAGVSAYEVQHVDLNDVQSVGLASIEVVAPDIAPSLSNPSFLVGVMLSVLLMGVSGLLLRHSAMAGRRAMEQNDTLRLEVIQRERAERDLLEERQKLEVTVEERNRSLTRELNRTNALLRDLEQAMDRVQRIVDIASEGFIEVDLDGRVVSCNQRTQRILGYDARELVGRQVETLVSHDSLPLLQEQLRLRVSSQTRTYSIDVLSKDGSLIPIEISSINEYENGVLRGSVGFFRDLRPIRQQARALEKAQQDLILAREEKAKFFSAMAHEIRSPVNAILGYTQMLLGAQGGTLTQRQKDQAQRIHQAGEIILSLVNESVDLVRVQGGMAHLTLEPVNAGNLLDDVSRLAAVLAERMGVTLSVEHYRVQGREAQIMVRADAIRLRQVLLNLVSNGIKYNQPGGLVRLTVSDGVSGTARFEVADTGIGISEKSQQSLFQPFERTGQERSGLHGSGLGLAVSRLLVEAMDGTISVHSEEGKGSVFTVEIPLSATSAKETQRRPRD